MMGQCAEDLCTAPVQAKGLCNRHYKALRRRTLTCVEEGCNGGVVSYSRCNTHMAAYRRETLGQTCTVDGCTTIRAARGLCWRHDWRTKRRARHDVLSQEIASWGHLIEIPLTDFIPWAERPLAHARAAAAA